MMCMVSFFIFLNFVFKQSHLLRDPSLEKIIAEKIFNKFVKFLTQQYHLDQEILVT